MRFKTNAQGEERKRLVQLVSIWLDTPYKYCGAPTFSYKIGAMTVDREGTILFQDGTDTQIKTTELVQHLKANGFCIEELEEHEENKLPVQHTECDEKADAVDPPKPRNKSRTKTLVWISVAVIIALAISLTIWLTSPTQTAKRTIKEIEATSIFDLPEIEFDGQKLSGIPEFSDFLVDYLFDVYIGEYPVRVVTYLGWLESNSYYSEDVRDIVTAYCNEPSRLPDKYDMVMKLWEWEEDEGNKVHYYDCFTINVFDIYAFVEANGEEPIYLEDDPNAYYADESRRSKNTSGYTDHGNHISYSQHHYSYYGDFEIVDSSGYGITSAYDYTTKSSSGRSVNFRGYGIVSRDVIREAERSIYSHPFIFVVQEDGIGIMNLTDFESWIKIAYKDSADKITESDTARLDEWYSIALELANTERYSEAIAAFEVLNGYKDSSAQVEACIAAKQIRDEEILLAEGYNRAIECLSGNTELSYIDAQQEAYDWLSSHSDYLDAADYLENFVWRCVSTQTVNESTKEIGSEVRFSYDSTGGFSSYELIYYSDGEISSNCLRPLDQEKYGNWYVCKLDEVGSYSKAVIITYAEPYSMIGKCPLSFSETGYVSSSRYTDGVLYVTVRDGDGGEIAYELLDNGNYRYTEKGNGKYQVTHVGTVVMDDQRNVIEWDDRGQGTAYDGKSYTERTTQNYKYDEHGNWVERNYTYNENWNGKTKTNGSTINRTIQYDENGSIQSLKSGNSDSIETYQYAFVYCPDAD